MRKHGPASLLITNLANIRYLSGFSGSSAALLVYRGGAVFFTDFRYRIQAEKEVRDCRLAESTGSLVEMLVREVSRRKISELGFESAYFTHQSWRELGKRLPGVKLAATEGMVESLRTIKDEEEIKAIRGAIQIAGKAYRSAARQLWGKTENNLSERMETAMRRAGAEGPAFPTIVASCPRSALPHASPTAKKVGRRELVIIDFGARWQGYHSDITRTRYAGRGNRFLKIYGLVWEAQRRAIAAVRPGARASEVDAAARGVIEAAGYGENFGHGTGHGVGLEVHERPSISFRNNEVLRPGMVFTVEPGIYIENFGGVRIEDVVMVTTTGCEVLSLEVPKLRRGIMNGR